MPNQDELGGNVIVGALRRIFKLDSGSPVDGSTLAGVAEPGDILTKAAATPTAYINTGTKASPTWTALVTSAVSGNTLDEAYDQGGAGSGRSITADSGAVAITVPDASGNAALALTQNDVTNNPAALTITNTGTGNDITGNAGNWSVTPDGDATFGGTLSVTGAATLSSTLSVTGAATFDGGATFNGTVTIGGTFTVADTLTVDELILDTDGVAPAATNVYLVRDNAGDLTLNAVSGKEVHIAVAGTDEYDFGASALDMNGNHLDNTGYVILNEVTVPAATEVYVARDNTGDLTLNALTGKQVHLAVAGTDLLDVGASEVVVNEGGGDVDFRIEGDANTALFTTDAGLLGGVGAVAFGRTPTAAAFLIVDNPAFEATAATDTYKVMIIGNNAITIPAGTTNIAASLYVGQPNLTVTGTLNNAATLYIANAPAEGTNNYALWVDSGATQLDGTLTVEGAATFNGAAVFNQGGGDYDFRVESSGNSNMLLVDAGENQVIVGAGASTGVGLHFKVDGHATTADANESFYRVWFNNANAITVPTGTAGNVSTLRVEEPNITATGTVTNAVSVYITGAPTEGTNNYALWVDSGNTRLDGSLRLNTNNAHATEGDTAITLANASTPPAGAGTGIASIYASGGELYALDSAGNATLISPHTPDGDYIIHSYSPTKDKTFRLHLEKFVRELVAVVKAKLDVDLSRHMELLDGMVHSYELAES